MKNFELIDDYLSNRLKGAEREAFEKQLDQDPTLKSDLAFQKQVVNGIRQARAAELKAMLNKVPVGGTVIEFSVMRMAAGLAGAAILAAGIYYYANRGEFPPIDKAATNVGGETPVKPDNTQPESQQPNDSSTTPLPEQKQDSPKKDDEKKPASKKTSQVTPVVKPNLEVADPSAELADDTHTNSPVTTAAYQPGVTASAIQVELDSSNKKYDFHYQFVNGKLMLYGPFDRSLYELLEVNGQQHAIFLVYKDSYYLLDSEQTAITKLQPIRESKLISTLKDYRKI